MILLCIVLSQIDLGILHRHLFTFITRGFVFILEFEFPYICLFRIVAVCNLLLPFTVFRGCVSGYGQKLHTSHTDCEHWRGTFAVDRCMALVFCKPLP